MPYICYHCERKVCFPPTIRRVFVGTSHNHTGHVVHFPMVFEVHAEK